MTRTSKTVSIVVTAPVTGAPTWLNNLAVGTWGTVASSATVSAVQPSPTPAATFSPTGNSGGSNADIFTAWTGATYDPVRNEYLMVANGGHADYAGNEAYALALWANSPYWYRLTAPTPNSSMTSLAATVDGSGFAKYADGRSRAMHTAGYQTYVNGKVWFTHQNSFTSAPGGGGFGILAFNRQLSGMPFSNATAPLAHDGGVGPWEFYTPLTTTFANQQAYAFSYAAYDNATGSGRGLIWSIGQDQNSPVYWSVDPSTGAQGSYTRGGNSFASEPSFWVACPDRGVILRGTDSSYSGQVAGRTTEVSVFYPATRTWVDVQTGPAQTSNAPFGGGRCGAVYYNGAVYVMRPNRFGTKIYKLTLPADLNGSWANVWSEINVAGGPTTDASQGTFTKLQLAKFTTAAALVIPTSSSGPTYVYRIS